MPVANSPDGTPIHYEFEGTGPPLVLAHGNFTDLKSWRLAGYTDRLSAHFSLILIDERGFGDSGKPGTPDAYRPELRVADTVAVLDDLDIQTAGYLGYSMGSTIGAATIEFAPDRFDAYVLGGFAGSPAEDDRPTFDDMLARWRGTRDVRKYVERGDLAVLRANYDGGVYPRASEAVRDATAPILLFAGAADPVHAAARDLAASARAAEFVSLPALNHLEAFLASDVVAALTQDFLERHDGSHPR